MPTIPEKGVLSPAVAKKCDALGCLMRTRIGSKVPGCLAKLEIANGRPLFVVKEDYPDRIPADCPEGFGKN